MLISVSHHCSTPRMCWIQWSCNRKCILEYMNACVCNNAALGRSDIPEESSRPTNQLSELVQGPLTLTLTFNHMTAMVMNLLLFLLLLLLRNAAQTSKSLRLLHLSLKHGEIPFIEQQSWSQIGKWNTKQTTIAALYCRWGTARARCQLKSGKMMHKCSTDCTWKRMQPVI